MSDASTERSRARWLAALVFASAGVAADAGYAEVRDLTAARLRKDVRWYQHDSRAPADEATKRLLAEPLTADAAVQLALLGNQGQQADFEELGIARARMVEALRLPNPTRTSPTATGSDHRAARASTWTC
jgi:hypothetical protein